MHEVPLPSWLSILMSPPNFLMIRRATVRPSPDPSPCPFVVKNGSKSFDRCCFGMPGPESAIVVTTDVSVRDVERRTVPCPFIACMAFINMFVNACLSWSGRASTQVSPAYVFWIASPEASMLPVRVAMA